MGRHVERLTLDNLALLPGPGRDLHRSGSSTRSRASRSADTRPRRRPPGSPRPARLGLRGPGGARRRRGGRPPALGAGGAPARGARVRHRPGEPGRRAARHGYVAPQSAGQGLGRILVQAMAKDLIRRGGIGAVEAFGAHRAREGECVLAGRLPARRRVPHPPPAPGVPADADGPGHHRVAGARSSRLRSTRLLGVVGQPAPAHRTSARGPARTGSSGSVAASPRARRRDRPGAR